MELTGKVAWITGGTRMGQAVAHALGHRGCRIVLSWRRSREAAEKIASALQNQGIDVTVLRCDLSQDASIRKTVQDLQRLFGRLDVLVHLASIYERSQAGKDFIKAWDAHLAANARSACLLTLSAAALMRRSGGGRVVHVSDWTSASGRPRYKDYGAYYVSKAAVKAATETLALEL